MMKAASSQLENVSGAKPRESESTLALWLDDTIYGLDSTEEQIEAKEFYNWKVIQGIANGRVAYCHVLFKEGQSTIAAGLKRHTQVQPNGSLERLLL
jgi:hypothetical protein